MRCRCGADLAHLNSKKEPIVRTRGIVFQSSGMKLVCPKCKADVPLSQDMAKAMQNSLVLFLRGPKLQ